MRARLRTVLGEIPVGYAPGTALVLTARIGWAAVGCRLVMACG
jgi:hypothetical protein